MEKQKILKEAKKLFKDIETYDIKERVDIINGVREMLHKISPFKNEPVDFVRWVPFDDVIANDYNPNTVAPPEMELLRISISEDGYTQPIVSWKKEDKFEVVDGFHRNRVAKEYKDVGDRISGYLPLAVINDKQAGRGDRIASTIRHNRARGKHKIEAMSDIVVELKNRNWSNERIAKNLGMEEDEVLRLCQITGLAYLFKDQEFSKSWNIEDSEADFLPLNDEIGDEEKELNGFRTVNTSDENRIFHTYDKWECHQAGFYETTYKNMTKEECEQVYKELLTDGKSFRKALNSVIGKWKNSCEHYLTNQAMNRIAWLGQASLCYAKGIPAVFRGGFNLLSEEQQNRANEIALEYLNKWLVKNGREKISMDLAMPDREATIY